MPFAASGYKFTSAAGERITYQHGGCSFAQKARVAQRAGHSALLVINTDDGAPAFPMGGTDEDRAEISIPVAMISRESALALHARLEERRFNGRDRELFIEGPLLGRARRVVPVEVESALADGHHFRRR